jgi:hypothetical protein
MLRRKDFLDKHPGVIEGTIVKCQDGERLGRVAAVDEDSIVVRKGIFFPKDFTCRFDDVADYLNGELIIKACHTDLSDWRNDSYDGWEQVDDVNEGRAIIMPLPEFRYRYQEWQSEETSQRGRKIVHTELKRFSVIAADDDIRGVA